MAKVFVKAASLCAVMILVASLPAMAASEHTVTRGTGGPHASAMTWSFVPWDYGECAWRIDNHELRWMIFQVFDNSTGVPTEIYREHIRFAAVGAYPTGITFTGLVMMAKDRPYEITATPNGPKGAYAIVMDPRPPKDPPIAMFTATVSGFTVAVDASASYDWDGDILSYQWMWGDGATGEGMIATHSYTGSGGGGPPEPPFILFGYVNGPDGGVEVPSIVRLENTRTGGFMLAETDPYYGAFGVNLKSIPGGMLVSGDAINITAWGSDMVGYNETVVMDLSAPYMFMNVTLGNFPVIALEATITLTVTDVDGLTSNATKTVVFWVP